MEDFGKELKENFNLLIEENQKLQKSSKETEEKLNKLKENEKLL